MKDNLQNQTDTKQPPHPLEVMRKVYRAMEITFEEEDDSIFSSLILKNVEVLVISFGEPDDLVATIVRLPVRAAPEFHTQTGEFLHRLNFHARRNFWEFNHDDGEIRLAAYTETMVGPLTETFFNSLLRCMVWHADVVFPYLTSVLSGRMSPEFAADQAEAALEHYWTDRNNPEDEERKSEGGR